MTEIGTVYKSESVSSTTHIKISIHIESYCAEMMCDRSAINMAIADEGTNTPVVEHEELKSGSQKIETREDGKIAVNELVPAEAGKKDVHDGCSSSSDDNDDDCDDDEDDEEEDGEDEDDRNVGKGGTDGNTPVLQLPLRYTKSGRKRSIPFPVRVSVIVLSFSYYIQHRHSCSLLLFRTCCCRCR